MSVFPTKVLTRRLRQPPCGTTLQHQKVRFHPRRVVETKANTQFGVSTPARCRMRYRLKVGNNTARDIEQKLPLSLLEEHIHKSGNNPINWCVHTGQCRIRHRESIDANQS